MKRRGRLAIRLLLLGLGQLVLLVVAAVAIAWITRPPPHAHDMHERVELAAERVRAGLDHDLEGTLARVARDLELEMTVHDRRGAVIASTVTPPLRAPSSEERPPPPPTRPPPPIGLPLVDAPHEPPRRHILASIDEAHVLVARGTPPPWPYTAAVLTILAGVLVVGAGAFLAARWIVRPLESLARAARAVGEGDLAARTGLDRRDEIGTVARTFDEMAERVETSMRAERELLANVSHELRTPLARIRVAMDLAAEGDAEGMRAAVAEIATDLGELESIVDDILVALRLDTRDRAHAGLPLSALEEIPAEELARRSVERFRARHPDRPLEVALEAGARRLVVDPVLFRRVIDNLLENADKYTPDRTAPIALRLREERERVVLEVEDRGIGIAAEDLPNVFAPFFRAERSRARDAGGVGLGLTLAERIVEAHGGTIEVESTLGRGTLVRVSMPG
ncbi:HAMP domain-containing sensor histidine kinase [Sandaracinus amylolyticus]|uniref:HAMP domain-containing sensor histidine kinase n=1 Tax=Sandaracinus amylolyticus TaxID=927083 RepID=UPI001F248ADE|nr:HAMP domain-containing sensor histidine kinase [Sandaracinus amylolyticus]UJR83249.1 Hypothetical protein I5071_53160 [Sandaracinus amylolyticus]